MVRNGEAEMTLGEKLKSARKCAGLTQEQLAEKLLVSRQAVTKWETDKGLPDIENLKQLSKLFHIGMDSLLDCGETMDLSVMREEIHLEDYTYTRKWRGRWSKKAGKKDMVVMGRYPNAEIHGLVGKQVLTKGERATDHAVGFLTGAPFGIAEFLNGIKNLDKEFYLVNQSDKQFLVVVTDEFMESRRLVEKVTDRKFSFGGVFVCGLRYYFGFGGVAEKDKEKP